MPENKVALSSMIKNPMTLALKRLSTLSSFPHRWVNISFWPDKYLRFFVGKLQNRPGSLTPRGLCSFIFLSLKSSFHVLLSLSAPYPTGLSMTGASSRKGGSSTAFSCCILRTCLCSHLSAPRDCKLYEGRVHVCLVFQCFLKAKYIPQSTESSKIIC